MREVRKGGSHRMNGFSGLAINLLFVTANNLPQLLFYPLLRNMVTREYTVSIVTERFMILIWYSIRPNYGGCNTGRLPCSAIVMFLQEVLMVFCETHVQNIGHFPLTCLLDTLHSAFVTFDVQKNETEIPQRVSFSVGRKNRNVAHYFILRLAVAPNVKKKTPIPRMEAHLLYGWRQKKSTVPTHPISG